MDPSTQAELNLKRAVTLLASLSVSLVSGTNYVVAAYAPQLAKELHLSGTEINIVAAAGNLGVYSVGPLWGLIVDSRGPKLNLLSAAVLLLVGYSGIRAFFIKAIPYTGSGSLIILSLASFLTGAGSGAGLSGGLNSVAKSFPDATRATATGVVLAGYGLSAFLFSSISHVFFPGDTSSFLLLLSWGCFIPCFVGIFIIQPVIPPVHSPAYNACESGWNRIDGTDLNHVAGPSEDSMNYADQHSSSLSSSLDEDQWDRENRQLVPTSPIRELSHLLNADDTPNYHTYSNGTREQGLEGGERGKKSKSVAILDEYPAGSAKTPGSIASLHEPLSLVISRGSVRSFLPHEVDLNGWALLQEMDFWLLTSIVCLLSGTGICWINNCGLTTLALISEGGRLCDSEELIRLQATQVSVISIWNCIGRISIGISSDLAKKNFRIRRIHFLSLISFVFLISQLVLLFTQKAEYLWITSSLLGLAYGGMFGLCPVVCLEWFGMANFSLNWGFVSMAPIVGSNLTNLVYGRVYDSHTLGKIFTRSTLIINKIFHMTTAAGGGLGIDEAHSCLLGRKCYAATFYLTSVLCILALFLSVFAGYRREIKSKRRAAAAAIAAERHRERELERSRSRSKSRARVRSTVADERESLLGQTGV
ncbi:Major facilitator superfamily domain, general substrate transporter [Phaffia rhodozyma]|uniref:Major facilitator superfamily domain, general substrate transporter n=1 Tax=Phaffia rhodozyma TaxID=264483 RepID=A0A0F7SWT8_PHARH|nr:Major facilitator superfamily domain, general substrate transporter [Phaffia rhodozyma]